MSRRTDIDRLLALSDMVLESRLATLRAAADDRNRSLRALETLDLPSRTTGEDSLVADAIADLRYRKWAEARRADINVRLARETAKWLECRDQAKLAFGRAKALRAISGKLRS